MLMFLVCLVVVGVFVIVEVIGNAIKNTEDTNDDEGEKDLTGKCIQTYKPSKLGGKNDSNIRINVLDTLGCYGLNYCQFFGEEAFNRK